MAPKNSNFGVLPSAAGSGRRSIIGIEASVSSSGAFGMGNDKHTIDNESASDQNFENYVNYKRRLMLLIKNWLLLIVIVVL